MTVLRIQTASVILAGLSFYFAQAGGADWAANFLQSWGWMGLFILSVIANIYQLRLMEKLRKGFEARITEITETLRRENKEARDELTRELQNQISMLRLDKNIPGGT